MNAQGYLGVLWNVPVVLGGGMDLSVNDPWVVPVAPASVGYSPCGMPGTTRGGVGTAHWEFTAPPGVSGNGAPGVPLDTCGHVEIVTVGHGSNSGGSGNSQRLVSTASHECLRTVLMGYLWAPGGFTEMIRMCCSGHSGGLVFGFR